MPNKNLHATHLRSKRSKRRSLVITWGYFLFEKGGKLFPKIPMLSGTPSWLQAALGSVFQGMAIGSGFMLIVYAGYNFYHYWQRLRYYRDYLPEIQTDYIKHHLIHQRRNSEINRLYLYLFSDGLKIALGTFVLTLTILGLAGVAGLAATMLAYSTMYVVPIVLTFGMTYKIFTNGYKYFTVNPNETPLIGSNESSKPRKEKRLEKLLNATVGAIVFFAAFGITMFSGGAAFVWTEVLASVVAFGLLSHLSFVNIRNAEEKRSSLSSGHVVWAPVTGIIAKESIVFNEKNYQHAPLLFPSRIPLIESDEDECPAQAPHCSI